MSRSIPVVILSVVFISGCVGAGEFGTQMGVFPRSNIPILGGGSQSVGKKIVHTKSGDEIVGQTYYDSRTGTYSVYSGKASSPKITTIPTDQVAYMESY